jgi:hypothetical protein
MKKLLIAVLLIAGVGHCGQLTFTTAEVESLLNRTDNQGWVIYSDTEYTIGSPLTVNDDIIQLTCNGLGANSNTNFLPASGSALWSTNDNRIVSDNAGNAFDVRVQFTGDPVGIDDYIDVTFDIGAGTNNIVITHRVVSSPKGGDPNTYSFTTAIYSLGTFVSNGCKINLDSTGGGDNWSIYDISVFVKQDYYD